MIRNIPNKYTVQNLLEEINFYFKGKFDLLYLPLDFENKCNLGYAFINLINALHIPMFYDIFQGQKWQKYKSEKQCDIRYAKYQGKKDLASHYEKNANNGDVIIL